MVNRNWVYRCALVMMRCTSISLQISARFGFAPWHLGIYCYDLKYQVIGSKTSWYYNIVSVPIHVFIYVTYVNMTAVTLEICTKNVHVSNKNTLETPTNVGKKSQAKCRKSSAKRYGIEQRSVFSVIPRHKILWFRKQLSSRDPSEFTLNENV